MIANGALIKKAHKQQQMDQQLEEGIYKKRDDASEQQYHQPNASLMCLLAVAILVILGLIQYSAIVLVDDE